MKSPSRPSFKQAVALLLLSASLPMGRSAFAANTLTNWTPSTAGTADWNDTTTTNWSNGVPTASSYATFINPEATSGANPTLSANSVADGVYFSTTTSSGYDIQENSTSNAYTLTLSATGTTTSSAIDGVNTSGTNTFDVPLVLGAASGTQTFTQATGGTLTINGAITNTNAVTLALTGGGTVNLTGAVGTSGISLSLNVTGVTLSSTGTITTGTSGVIVGASGTATFNAVTSTGTGISVSAGGSATLNGVLTSSGTSSSSVVNVVGANATFLEGVNGSIAGGSTGLVANLGGSVTLNGSSNTFNNGIFTDFGGSITIGGALTTPGATNLNLEEGSFTYNGTAGSALALKTVAMNGQSVYGSSTLTANGPTTGAASSLTATSLTRGTGSLLNLNLSNASFSVTAAGTGGVSVGGILPFVVVNGTDFGAYSGTNAGTISAYTGYTVAPAGTSTYPSATTGAEEISTGSGTVSVSGTTQTNSLLVNDANTRTIALGGGNLNFNTVGTILTPATAGALTIGSSANDGTVSAGGSTANTAGELILANYSSHTNVMNSAIANNGTGAVSVSVLGSGAWTLAGTNSYSGNTYLGINATLNVNNASALGTSILNIGGGTIDNTSAAPVTVANNVNVETSFAYGGTNSLYLSSTTQNFGSESPTITTNGTGVLTLAGNQTNYAFAKAGTGTLALTGQIAPAHGSLTLSAGTLLADNGTNAFGSGGTLTVASGVTLGGTGNFTNGTVSVSSGGTLLAGNGTFLVAGSTSVGGTSPITGGTNGALGMLTLSTTTSLTVSAGAVLEFYTASGSTNSSIVRASGATSTVTFPTSGNAVDFEFLNPTAGTYNVVTGLSSQPADLADFALYNTPGYTATFGYSGGDITATLTLVPEPKTSVAGVFLLLACFCSRQGRSVWRRLRRA